MKTEILGHSELGLPITAYRFGGDGPNVLLMGGVHGDEREGVELALGIFDKFLKSYHLPLNLTLLPMVNIDGVIAKTRRNANGVDLNRNMPTKDWSHTVAEEKYHPGKSAGSESEVQILMRLLEEFQPELILTFHSWKPMLNINGRCRKIAEAIAAETNYEVTEDIGYPTPGSFGTYAGIERDIPTVTYEVERGLATQKILEIHVPAVIKALSNYQEEK
jgi:protein MpaA